MEQKCASENMRISPFRKKEAEKISGEDDREQLFSVLKEGGETETFDVNRIRSVIRWAAEQYIDTIHVESIVKEVLKNIFDGISPQEIFDALILSTTDFIEIDPVYGFIAARLLTRKLQKEVAEFLSLDGENFCYKTFFIRGIQTGLSKGVLDERMNDFDLDYLAQHIQGDRDNLFNYMGLRTLYERYFLRSDKDRLELPQSFWMRVAMGLSYNEKNKNEKAVELYNIMSTFRYVPSTPTLLHSGLARPQLSSCFLSTVEDDLNHIFKCYGDNAQLSKWSGGVANDWSNVRATGSMVKSINTESQGVVPFLKIVNDVTAAINRSGKRRGATVVYLETWHYEIEDFIDLRKNTGDERRRAHDINTAHWIPDLFMKRVIEDKNWTLFSPEEVPDLHHIFGKKFEERYEHYEQQAREGNIKIYKIISAKQLWRKMLSRLFETGHPWITFKDPANVRSPQDHAGVVHSSNLCTEILLNTSQDETAVCNLGSVNLAEHIDNGHLDKEKLAQTIEIAICALDNVIDINFYPTKEAETANLRHRPIGLGVMGFQDALYKQDISFGSLQALEFADTSMEFISYHAILSSSKLAKERGAYFSYKGSKWDRDIFPQDTIDLLEQERGVAINVKRGGTLDWSPVRLHVQQYGMRNSNTMAIAPTATISNIVGSFPCIEPIYKNIYVKSNMSGEFTVVNKYLIDDLKKLGMWNQGMLNLVKYYDGNIQMIETIPQEIREKYKEAFELDPLFLIEMSATRGKWIDQSQAHNVFMRGASGKMLHDIYMTAWRMGLKTTYYLRTLGATQIEKSTLSAKEFGYTQKRSYATNGMQNGAEQKNGTEQQNDNEDVSLKSIVQNEEMQSCSILNDPDCEVCQ